MWALTVRTWSRATPCWRQAWPLGVKVEDEGLEAVEGGGESGFGGLTGFELFPEGTEAPALASWQQAVDAVGSRAFARGLPSLGFLVVDESVPGINLHDVVHEQHGNDPRDVRAR